MSEVPPPKTPPGGFPFAARPGPQDAPAAPPPAVPAAGQQGFQQLSIAQLRAAQAAGTPASSPPPASPPSNAPVVKQGQLGSVVIPPWEAPPQGRDSRHSGAAQPLPHTPDDTYNAPHMVAPEKEPLFDRGHVVILIASVLLTILTFVELVVVGFKVGLRTQQAVEAAQQIEAERSAADRTSQGSSRTDSLYPSTRSSSRSGPENEIDRVQRENERRERMDAYSAERADDPPPYHPANSRPEPEPDTTTTTAPAAEEPASSSGGGFEMATPVPE